MLNPKDFIGNTYHYLTIIEDAGMKPHKKCLYRFVIAKCKCGNIKEYQLTLIKSGNTKSCGCYHQEQIKKANYAHGLVSHPLYGVWSNMKRRCYYKKTDGYKNYGGRGITVCDEWHDFKPFYNWCIANGYKEGLEIDRYPDNNGNYEPTNCRFVTGKVNCRNKRNNHLITHDGQTLCLVDWAEKTGISYTILRARLNDLNWSIKKALTHH